MTDEATFWRQKWERERKAREQAELALEERGRALFLEKKEAERVLGLVTTALESVNQGFLLLGPDLRVLRVNRRMADIFPLIDEAVSEAQPIEVVLRENADNLYVPKNGSIDAVIDNQMRHLRLPIGKWDFRTVDGRIYSIDPYRTIENGIVCLYTDVTRTRETTRQLRQRQVAIDSSIDAVCIVNKNDEIIYANPSIAQIFGYKVSSELVGQSSSVLFNEDENNRLKIEVFPLLDRDGRWLGESSGRRQDGSEVPLEASIAQLADGSRVCVYRDISERKHAEQERATFQEQIHRSQKIEALGKLSSGVAHEFNNILAAVLGYANLLVEDLESMPDSQGFAREIVKAGERASRLVEQIRSFSRQQNERKFQSTDMIRLVEDTIDIFRASLQSSIIVEMQSVKHDKITAMASSGDIGQAVMNVLVNASEAIGKRGGLITVCMDLVLGEELVCFANCSVGGMACSALPEAGAEYCRISIQDTGVGMDPAILSRIFDPFFTTKDIGEGTGMGLAAVQGIINAHKGLVCVTSEQGSGSTFALCVPVSPVLSSNLIEERPAPKPALVSEWETEPLNEEHKILVVDDEPLVSGAIVSLLKRAGFETTIAEDGQEALNVLNNKPEGYFNLIVTDKTMPTMNGLQLIETIRRRGDETPILVCSGNLEAADETSALRFNNVTLLGKPVDRDRLIEVAKAACIQKSVVGV